MPLYGLFSDGASEPFRTYKAAPMASQNGVLLLYDEYRPLCIVCAVALKDGQRIEELATPLKPATLQA